MCSTSRCPPRRLGRGNSSDTCPFFGLSASFTRVRVAGILSDMSDWIQGHWYELGSLALQLAILAVVVSYGRKALRILSAPLAASRAASQAQVELLQDLQKLSETRDSRPPAEPKAVAYGGVGHVLSLTPAAPTGGAAETAVLAHREVISPWHALAAWLQTPTGNRPAPAWRRVIRQVS